MLATIKLDETGYLVEATDVLWSEPVLISRRYRVNAIHGRWPADGERVRLENSIWWGAGFSAGSEEYPESTEERPLKPPTKRHCWRDGEWKRC